MAASKHLLRSAPSVLRSRTTRPSKSPLAWTQCRRCLSDSPQQPPGQQNFREPVRLLSEVDSRGRKLPEKVPPKKKDPFGGVWFPKTRIVLGVIFISIMIWDMVRLTPRHRDTLRPLTVSSGTMPLTPNTPTSISSLLPLQNVMLWPNVNLALHLHPPCALGWKHS